jgi:hypothetical protein
VWSLSTGAGATLTLAWNSPATTLAPQPSGGGLTTNGPVTFNNLGTGTAAKYVCVTSAQVMVIQAEAC